MFGQKDYQQLLVVRRMAADLGLHVEIVGAPTVREPDGLALSSRNAYLTPAERAKAPALYQNLKVAADEIAKGAAIDTAVAAAHGRIVAAGFRVDYVKLRNADTLARVDGSGARTEAPAGGRLARQDAADRQHPSLAQAEPGKFRPERRRQVVAAAPALRSAGASSAGR